MKEEGQGTSIHKVLGFASAGLVVALGTLLFVVYAPNLRHESAGERLQAALADHFPGSEAEVTHAGSDALQVKLKVNFDPAVDAAQAHETFQRTREVVRAQDIERLRRLEIELQGTGLDGGATCVSRTFEITTTADKDGSN